MRLFVGLGNPGAKYARNRHNIGFLAVDEIVHRHSFSAYREKFNGLVSEGTLDGEKVLVLKPMTYMNRSGNSVHPAVQFYKLTPDDVVVFHDDLDLVPGKVRVKKGGGHGGHNGLRSIDPHLGRDYWRVRLGIGHPGDKNRVHGYVLQDFSKAEIEGWLVPLIEAQAGEANLLARGEFELYMTRVAQRVPPPSAEPRSNDTRSNEEP